MEFLLGFAFWIAVIWLVVVFVKRRNRAKVGWRDVAKPTTLSRPARVKSSRDGKCPHRSYEPVDVNGIVVANICLNPECGEQLGPVVSRDPDGHVYFSEY